MALLLAYFPLDSFEKWFQFKKFSKNGIVDSWDSQGDYSHKMEESLEQIFDYIIHFDPTKDLDTIMSCFPFFNTQAPEVFQDETFSGNFQTVHEFFMQALVKGLPCMEHYNVFILSSLMTNQFTDIHDVLKPGIHYFDTNSLTYLGSKIDDMLQSGSADTLNFVIDFYPLIPINYCYFITAVVGTFGPDRTRSLIMDNIEIIEESSYLENAFDFVLQELTQGIELAYYCQKFKIYIKQNRNFPLQIFYAIIDNDELEIYIYIDFISYILCYCTAEQIGPLENHNFERLFHLYNLEIISAVYFSNFIDFLLNKLKEEPQHLVNWIGIIQDKLNAFREKDSKVRSFMNEFERFLN